MTSIGNDAFTVGTAAVAAGTANVVAQKSAAIREVLDPVKDSFVKGAKASVTSKPYKRAGQAIARAYKSFTSKLAGLFKKAKKPGAPKALLDIKFPAIINGEKFNNISEIRQKAIDMARVARAENIMQQANEAKAALLAKTSAFASPEAKAYFKAHGQKFGITGKISRAGQKVVDSVKSINWARVGKYAAVAAAVATAAVVVKNVFFNKED